MSVLNYRKEIENISPYVPAKSIEKIKAEYDLDTIVKLSANENTMGCSPLAQKAIIDAIKNVYLYPDGNCTKVRKRLAKIHNIGEDQIIFGNGSFELIALIAETFINARDESIIPEPTFKWYKVVTLAMGGKPITVSLKNNTIDLNEVKNKITDKTKIIWLCNPNNPTGTIFGKSELDYFLESIPKDIIVVLDEAYSDFNTNDSYPDSLSLIEKYPNIISLRTFSKIYGMASLRVGYGISNPEMISYINRIRIPSNVNRLAQEAAAASLDDEEFKNSVLENVNKGKAFLYKAFDEMQLEYLPSETNFIMVNVVKDGAEVVNELLKTGLYLRSGKEFNMPTWLRITIGKEEENKLIVEGLKKVLNK